MISTPTIIVSFPRGDRIGDDMLGGTLVLVKDPSLNDILMQGFDRHRRALS